jgi:hypothetical protein
MRSTRSPQWHLHAKVGIDECGWTGERREVERERGAILVSF